MRNDVLSSVPLGESIGEGFDQIEESDLSTIVKSEMSGVFENMISIVEEDQKARRLRKEQAIFSDKTHNGISCSNCGMCPIIGIRYQSLKDAS